jgi:hypothetical protein
LAEREKNLLGISPFPPLRREGPYGSRADHVDSTERGAVGQRDAKKSRRDQRLVAAAMKSGIFRLRTAF